MTYTTASATGTVVSDGNVTMFVILGAVLVAAAGIVVIVTRKRRAKEQ